MVCGDDRLGLDLSVGEGDLPAGLLLAQLHQGRARAPGQGRPALSNLFLLIIYMQ